ncbi:MAG: hypothetical protein GF331_10945 [Chitinivibrionales bacterium]|nr:hypothetical protein [Chitinivibrionales bacterium]
MSGKSVGHERRYPLGEHGREAIVWDDVLNLRIDLETLSAEELHARYFTIQEGAAYGRN